MVSTSFSDDQIFSLVVLERTGGALSLFSVCLIFIVYGLFEKLRTVPNTFIVFASVANAGASIASIIAYNGVWQGTNSSLCQAQGFLFEMFVQSDPWWSLAMAINVLMVFFGSANPHTIKKWGWLYCLICYGGPFVIALVCLQLRAPDKTVVYGSAGLWCWISNDWNPLRIYSYYMLIWICIILSMFIYIGIGYYVFRARNRLQQFTNTTVSQTRDTTIGNHNFLRDKSNDWPLPTGREDCLGAVNIVTEVRVTHSDSLSPIGLSTPPNIAEKPRVVDNKPLPPHPAVRPTGISTTVTSKPRIASNFYGTAAHALRSGTPATRGPTPQRRRLFRRLVVLDPVKRAYLRTAFLFALSVLVTWIPSSINRIRGLIYSDSPYSYNVATATVLPLQGVWNAVIFFITSWKVLRQCFAEWRRRRTVVELVDLQTGARRRARGAHRIPGSGAVWSDVKLEGRSIRIESKERGAMEERDIDGEDHWDFADVGLEGSDVELRAGSTQSNRSF